MEPKLGSVYLNIRKKKTACQKVRLANMFRLRKIQKYLRYKDKSSDLVKEVRLRNAIKMMLIYELSNLFKMGKLKIFLANLSPPHSIKTLTICFHKPKMIKDRTINKNIHGHTFKLK